MPNKLSILFGDFHIKGDHQNSLLCKDEWSVLAFIVQKRSRAFLPLSGTRAGKEVGSKNTYVIFNFNFIFSANTGYWGKIPFLYLLLKNYFFTLE